MIQEQLQSNLELLSKGVYMPEVGKKHFSYSKKGKAKAKVYAKKKGLKVSNAKKRRGY